ncbi:HNH endonuclease family protein [Nocardia altamirensis]|uniref:HNH endonuclease family protein n=1 Tax=Nocardia altamirensis TaxID=472158 RepID=UPI00350E557D
MSVPLGHNGCDTRNDILKRDLIQVSFVPRTRDCKVAAGELADLYTGKDIHFVRGATTSDDVQIDHVVALSDAWQKGAQQLSPERRRDMANDPLNLQAVDGPTNQAKGDSDAATWLPPSKGYRCTYVVRQIRVKAAYGLWVTGAEKAAMSTELDSCG